MKITDSNQLSNPAGLGRTRQSEALAGYGAGAGAGRTQSGGDQVELSGLAGKLAGALGADAPERGARVERLAQLYAAGRYQPDAAGASRGLIQQALAEGPAMAG